METVALSVALAQPCPSATLQTSPRTGLPSSHCRGARGRPFPGLYGKSIVSVSCSVVGVYHGWNLFYFVTFSDLDMLGTLVGLQLKLLVSNFLPLMVPIILPKNERNGSKDLKIADIISTFRVFSRLPCGTVSISQSTSSYP